jgi:hypothetical protein
MKSLATILFVLAASLANAGQTWYQAWEGNRMLPWCGEAETYDEVAASVRTYNWKLVTRGNKLLATTKDGEVIVAEWRNSKQDCEAVRTNFHKWACKWSHHGPGRCVYRHGNGSDAEALY